MPKRKSPAASTAAPEAPSNVARLPVSLRNVRVLARMPDVSTINLLKQLLRGAEAGNLAGLVAVALFPRGHAKKYDFSLAGIAGQNPTLAVGAMDVCQMLLREIALKESGID